MISFQALFFSLLFLLALNAKASKAREKALQLDRFGLSSVSVFGEADESSKETVKVEKQNPACPPRRLGENCYSHEWEDSAQRPKSGSSQPSR